MVVIGDLLNLGVGRSPLGVDCSGGGGAFVGLVELEVEVGAVCGESYYNADDNEAVGRGIRTSDGWEGKAEWQAWLC